MVGLSAKYNLVQISSYSSCATSLICATLIDEVFCQHLSMSARSKKLTINLVPQDPFLESPLGRFMQWGMGAGRYIVIFTEIIVILSFAARFTLDRQITDLNSELNSQIRYIEGYQELESQVRLIQAQTAEIKKQRDSNNMLLVFEELSTLIPLDVSFSRMSISRGTLSAEGKALSQQAFSTLINNMQLSNLFHNIRIGKIESSGESTSEVTFTLTASTQQAPKAVRSVAPVPAANTETEDEGESMDIPIQ